jgi:hypothetical protein
MVARHRTPFYKLSELVKACSLPGKVFVRKDAKEDAKSFGFDTQDRLLRFIANNVFEDLKHENTDELDFGQDVGTTFDAYLFRVGPKYVYFAFYKKQSGVWIIKSFHTPTVGESAPSLSHSPFAMLEELKK